MNQAIKNPDGLADPLATPLEKLDIADPRRFEHDTWPPLFERLRNEAPVHYQADGPGDSIFGRSVVMKTSSRSRKIGRRFLPSRP